MIIKRIRTFFSPDGQGGGAGQQTQQPAANQQTQQTAQQQSGQQTQQPVIDYVKIQQMLDGTLAAKEDTALKAYFKQQNLSQEEVEQAISVFKAEKAKNQPDVNAIQTQLTQTQAEIQKAKVENAAILEAVGMGIDSKTIPYLIKMADFSSAVGQDGKINNETIKNALNKVVEDIPQLKAQPQESSGFKQVGGTGGGGGQNQPDTEALKRAFGLG